MDPFMYKTPAYLPCSLIALTVIKWPITALVVTTPNSSYLSYSPWSCTVIIFLPLWISLKFYCWANSRLAISSCSTQMYFNKFSWELSLTTLAWWHKVIPLKNSTIICLFVFVGPDRIRSASSLWNWVENFSSFGRYSREFSYSKVSLREILSSS